MAFTPLNSLIQLRKQVCIAHHIPGRIRLRFNSGVIGQLTSFPLGEIKTLVDQFPALTHYKLNLATRSLLLEYNHNHISPQLLDAVFHTNDQTADQACVELIETLTRIHYHGA